MHSRSEFRRSWTGRLTSRAGGRASSAPFALALRLLPALFEATAPRVVTTTSTNQGLIDFDNLNGERNYHPIGAYARSKLADLLFSQQLARIATRRGGNLSSVASHPGNASTSIFYNGTQLGGCAHRQRRHHGPARITSHPPTAGNSSSPTNHLGHVALTVGPHDAPAAAGHARVVNVSSADHRSPIVFDDINFPNRPYDPWSAYARSKIANILMAGEAPNAGPQTASPSTLSNPA